MCCGSDVSVPPRPVLASLLYSRLLQLGLCVAIDSAPPTFDCPRWSMIVVSSASGVRSRGAGSVPFSLWCAYFDVRGIVP